MTFVAEGHPLRRAYPDCWEEDLELVSPSSKAERSCRGAVIRAYRSKRQPKRSRPQPPDDSARLAAELKMRAQWLDASEPDNRYEHPDSAQDRRWWAATERLIARFEDERPPSAAEVREVDALDALLGEHEHAALDQLMADAGWRPGELSDS